MDTQNPDPKSSAVSPDENLPAETPEGQLAAVTAERDRLAAEKAEIDDRLRRAWAEFENARRRAERERSDFLQFATADLVRNLLPIVDDFERALKTETADKEYAKGIELIYSGLPNVEADGAGTDRDRRASISTRTTTRRCNASRPRMRRTRRFWESSRAAIISKASFSGPLGSKSQSIRKAQ